jgi:hypothetical protein
LSARKFALILCLSLAVAALLRFAPQKTKKRLGIGQAAGAAKLRDEAKRPRKVYPYSVIPGGAYSSEELNIARRTDRVVGAHYSDFDAAAIRVRTLPEDGYFYVSYRRADRVYWTANKRRVPKGEAVLTDGAHLARTRCGNRLSAVPQYPVAAGPQPTEVALNAPEVPAGIEQPPLFAPLYDAPVLPLADARDRAFAFPTGMTGASPLGEGFPEFRPGSPGMVVANLPFGTLGGGRATSPGGTGPGGSSPGGGAPGGSSPGGTGPVGSGPGGSGPGGTGPVGSGPGGSGPVGSGPGGTGPGGSIPLGTVPEPGNAALALAGVIVLLFGWRARRRRSKFW